MPNIYSRLGRWVKKATGIRDISLARKNLHKRVGKLLYHKKYTAKDLVGVMAEMGMRRGSTVCIHSSMKEFYNFRGTAEGLIKAILDHIGPEGTLVMPAFPKQGSTYSESYVFDPKNDPTGAGYLAETFRKYPGVRRSNNVRHSVCAIGPNAEYLLKDHTRGHDCWDEHSPWQRLAELDALVFNLGMPRNYIGTVCHCVESILRDDYPYWGQFFNKHLPFKYLDAEGNVQTYSEWCTQIERRTREKKLYRFFTEKEWEISRISNLEVKVFYSKAALDKMVQLGRRGITQYYVPSPKGWEFDK